MPPGKRIAAFFIGVAIIYALMMLAWPIMAAGYGGAFRFAGQLLISRIAPGGQTTFEPLPSAGASAGNDALDTQLVLRNIKTQVIAKHPVSSRYLGYVPTVMVMALALATPLPWQRRWRALLWNLLLVHAFIAMRIALIVISDFAIIKELATFSLGSCGNAVLSFVTEQVSVSIVGCYVGPLLIWVLATFRNGDWALLAATGKPPPHRT